MNISIFSDFAESLPIDLVEIMKVFEGYGFEIRIVGGAVRDVAMGKAPRDIDVATDASPDEIAFILQSKYEEFGFVLVDPKGIRHGTMAVTTAFGNTYEITSLAFSIKESNGRLIINRHRDWKTDALRRDFTVNAMSMGPDGELFDYLDGLGDLANERIKFVGFYKLRLALEPIMVLRFAKLATRFKDPKYNISVLKFIRKNQGLLDGIHPETLAWFLEEIRNSENPQNAIPILRSIGIAPEIR